MWSSVGILENLISGKLGRPYFKSSVKLDLVSYSQKGVIGNLNLNPP